MDNKIITDLINIPDWLRIVAGFISAAIITFISVPTIVLISKHKKLFDVPNERTSHVTETPTLGGLAVFAGFTTAVILFSHRSAATELAYILGGLIPLFFIGIKDDILVIDPKKKLIGQLVASIIVVWIGGIYITDFHHTFGVDEINTLVSIVFTLFLFLLLINGFNLIDGIDGLASAIGFFAATFFGIWFILAGNVDYGIIGICLAGTLVSFFWYNVFGKENKIFLGDTGSMVIGFLMAILTVKFLECDLNAHQKYRFDAAPAVAIGLLIIPLFDTLRVFVLRLGNGKSPFKADRNHIHHILLSMGLSHLRVTIIILLVNLFFVLFSIVFQRIGVFFLILLMLIFMAVLSFVLHAQAHRHKQ